MFNNSLTLLHLFLKGISEPINTILATITTLINIIWYVSCSHKNITGITKAISNTYLEKMYSMI